MIWLAILLQLNPLLPGPGVSRVVATPGYTHWLSAGNRAGLTGTSGGREYRFNNGVAYRYYKFTSVNNTSLSQTYWNEVNFRVGSGYTHAISSGDRTATITITTSTSLFTFNSGTISQLVDGNTANNTAYIPTQTLDGTEFVKFDLGSSVAVNGITLYTQFSDKSQGNWVIAGSHDDSTYVTLAQIYGIVETLSASLFTGTTARYDGVTNSGLGYIPNQTLDATEFIKWDFTTTYILNGIKLYSQLTNAQGTWQLAGSNDDSNWTNIGSSFALSGSSTGNAISFTNAVAYRYYRISAVSGTVSQTYWYEVEFSIANP